MPQKKFVGVQQRVLHVVRAEKGEKPADYAAFMRVLDETWQLVPLPIYAMVAMPNHWHFVVRPTTDDQVSEFFRRLTVMHTMRYHAHYKTGGTGHLYTRWGLGVETHPTKVSANGGKFHFNDETEFPDTQQATFEYPGDGQTGSQRLLIYEQRLWSTNYPHNTDSGAEFYGTKGQM